MPLQNFHASIFKLSLWPLFYHYVNMDHEIIQATEEPMLCHYQFILFLSQPTSRKKLGKILIRHLKVLNWNRCDMYYSEWILYAKEKQNILYDIPVWQQYWTPPLSLQNQEASGDTEFDRTWGGGGHFRYQHICHPLLVSNYILGLDMESVGFIYSSFYSFIHSTNIYCLPAVGQELGRWLRTLFLASWWSLPSSPHTFSKCHSVFAKHLCCARHCGGFLHKYLSATSQSCMIDPFYRWGNRNSETTSRSSRSLRWSLAAVVPSSRGLRTQPCCAFLLFGWQKPLLDSELLSPRWATPTASWSALGNSGSCPSRAKVRLPSLSRVLGTQGSSFSLVSLDRGCPVADSAFFFLLFIAFLSCVRKFVLICLSFS